MKKNTYFENLKTKEELESLLQELYTYYDLEFESFDFGTGLVKNTGECKLGVEYVYYEMDIQLLKEILDNWDNNFINNKSKKYKGKFNHYQRKMYWHRDKLLAAIKSFMPWWSYSDFNNNGKTYYKRYYQSNKKTRKLLCKPVRRKINNCINEDYDVCSMKGMNWKKTYNYKWDIW